MFPLIAPILILILHIKAVPFQLVDLKLIGSEEELGCVLDTAVGEAVVGLVELTQLPKLPFPRLLKLAPLRKPEQRFPLEFARVAHTLLGAKWRRWLLLSDDLAQA